MLIQLQLYILVATGMYVSCIAERIAKPASQLHGLRDSRRGTVAWLMLLLFIRQKLASNSRAVFIDSLPASLLDIAWLLDHLRV